MVKVECSDGVTADAVRAAIEGASDTYEVLEVTED